MIEMIAGAARELKLGDPRDPATHIGPVIDAEAKAAAGRAHRADEARGARALRRRRAGAATSSRRISSSWPTRGELAEEVFGPILHVVRYRAGELDARAATSIDAPATA